MNHGESKIRRAAAARGAHAPFELSTLLRKRVRRVIRSWALPSSADSGSLVPRSHCNSRRYAHETQPCTFSPIALAVSLDPWPSLRARGNRVFLWRRGPSLKRMEPRTLRRLSRSPSAGGTRPSRRPRSSRLRGDATRVLGDGAAAVEIHGYLARPAGESGGSAGVSILIHEWWGLNDNIRADRRPVRRRRLSGPGGRPLRGQRRRGS